MTRLTAMEAARRSPQKPATRAMPDATAAPGADPGAFADVVELLDRLGAGGVEVALDGDGLAVTPWPAVAEDDRAALRSMRDRIVAFLTADREALRAPRHFAAGWRARPAPAPAPEAEVEKPAPKPKPKLLAKDLTEAELRAVRAGRPGMVRSAGGHYVEPVSRPGGTPLGDVPNLRVRTIIQERK